VSRWFRWDGDDLLLWIRVKPKSTRDAFDAIEEDGIAVRVTAPPVDGKANQHILAWLARQFQVAKSAVRIENGERSKRKRVRISAPKRIPEALENVLARKRAKPGPRKWMQT